MKKEDIILRDLVAFRSYSKYIETLHRRETMEEIVNRKMIMDLDKFGPLSKSLSKDIIEAHKMIHDAEIMPSMRQLQFSGTPIMTNSIKSYNCSYLPIIDIKCFSEIFYLLLSGAGVGYSVKKLHISKLPIVRGFKEEGIFIVHDSIEGWAQTIDILFEAYFNKGIRPIFDFSRVRPKGSKLSTTGATAPGPEPLKKMLSIVESLLVKAIGRRLTSLEVHDIVCIISDSVIAGGHRRSACLCLFDKDDNEMLTCKHGEWSVKYPWRARANNSVSLNIASTTYEEFEDVFEMCRKSNSGEPGFAWTNDEDFGLNPCAEISLEPFNFCNLTTINQSTITDKKDFLKRVKYATFLGTLQSTYTEFPFIREQWRINAENTRLLGVSFTGIADNVNLVDETWLQDGAELALKVNATVSKRLGINCADRITTVKPEGTTSVIMGSSSGIHPRYAEYYIRRVQINKDTALAKYLSYVAPELVEDCISSPNTVVFACPQVSPEDSITRKNETALSLFNRALMYNQYWISPTHRSGANKNNTSCTLYVMNDEWDELKETMWFNREKYTGMSILPFDGGSYKQAPFEEIDKQTYESMLPLLNNIDIKEVSEDADYTTRSETIACGGGSCEIV